MFKKLQNKANHNPVLNNGDIESTDNLGVYPRDVHVASLESRRALWTARAFAVGMFLSLAVNIALGFALATLEPWEKRVQPMLLTTNQKTEQIVNVEPFEKGIAGFKLLTKLEIKDYILKRESITMHKDQMEFNWKPGGYIHSRTTDDAFKVFQNQLPSYRKRFEKGLQRDIEILAIEEIGPKYWSVKFQTADTDLSSNSQVDGSVWRATLTIDFLPQKVMYEDRFLNPIGFTITKYSVVKI